MDYDVLIVGAGPSGLAAGIRIKQKNPMLSVCILDKGAQIGAHLLSGAVLELQSLKKLLPDDWTNAPLGTPVTKDAFYWLSKRHAIRLPTPKPMTNRGNHIISLSLLCQYLAEKATLLGCDVYPGFAAVDALFHEQGHVMGVISGDVGIDAHGTPGENFQAGIPIHAQQTLFAEGCRGQVSEKLIHHFQLRQGIQPQTYGLGIKEIWRIDPQNHQQGHVLHTIGWPLDTKTYGGSFVYHQNDHQIALGLVAGLDYKNPYFSPFEEMQRFKTHPKIARLLKNGERLAYGARALNEGGWQSIPKLTFPGGALIGDAAGFLNVAKIKGIHHAIESGILAADACVLALSTEKKSGDEIINYQEAFQTSWMEKELYKVRNIRPGFQKGLVWGLINAAFETYVSKGHSPWTLPHKTDHTSLKYKHQVKAIQYPKPDGILTFDKASSVYLTNSFHEANQPCHLQLKNPEIAITINHKLYDSPETRYCPAGVYEFIENPEGPKLQINAQNCIHCKTCDIKDPKQNILWTAPEGGGGPNYIAM